MINENTPQATKIKYNPSLSTYSLTLSLFLPLFVAIFIKGLALSLFTNVSNSTFCPVL